MAGCGGVDNDEIRGSLLLERLHLAEDEDVLHTRDRRGHDLERARADQPFRDAPQPVVLEVVDERLIGGERPAADPRRQLRLLVPERWAAEAGRQPRFALDLDDQHAQAGVRSGGGEGRGHRRLPYWGLAPRLAAEA